MTASSARSMSRDSQAGVSCHLPARSSSLNAATPPPAGRACSIGALNVGAHRSPERRQHPLRALLVLPRAQRAPDALRIERLRVVADERRRVQRRAVILAAQSLAIEQPQPALLARADQELPLAVVDRDRRRVDVEIAPPEPVRVGRAEVVGELQLLVGVELHADDAVAEAAGQRVELRVAGSEVDPCLPDRWPRRGGPTARRPRE